MEDSTKFHPTADVTCGGGVCASCDFQDSGIVGPGFLLALGIFPVPAAREESILVFQRNFPSCPDLVRADDALATVLSALVRLYFGPYPLSGIVMMASHYCASCCGFLSASKLAL